MSVAWAMVAWATQYKPVVVLAYNFGADFGVKAAFYKRYPFCTAGHGTPKKLTKFFSVKVDINVVLCDLFFI